MQPKEQNNKNDTNPYKKIDLEKIYPTPKSLKERERAQQRRDQMYEDRKPKHIF
jgi:hypothetical protein